MTDEIKMPSLTLEPFAEEVAAPKTPVVEAPPAVLNEDSLTEQEREIVNAFVEKIDINNSNMVLQYGADAQRKMADFSEMALESVRTKNLGAVGDELGELVVELKGFNAGAEAPKKGLFGIFNKVQNQIAKLQAGYSKVETNVEKISETLEGHQLVLLKDIAVLDEMYAKNLTNFRELSMYIVAGKKKLEQTRAETLPALIAQAEKSGLQEDAQKANDLASMCDRFEKKLYDLELTRTVSIQMAPQIRLVQGNNSMMAEKIQTTLVNTIPLWKSQMVIALGLAHSQQAMEAQRKVSDMTNELLKKNADALKMATVETAKESERGIIDIETLKYTNAQLISTIDEVIVIQNDGRAKRAAAEVELGKIEGQLRQKLLEVKR